LSLQSSVTLTTVFLFIESQDNGETIMFRSANAASSKLASLLHLLRAGFCNACIASFDSSAPEDQWNQKCRYFIGHLQQAQPTNLLSVYIRQIRNIDDGKIKVTNNLVRDNLDIVVGVYVFPRKKYTRLIPIVNKNLEDTFKNIFLTDVSRMFDPAVEIIVEDWSKNEFVAGSVGSSTDFRLRPSFNKSLVDKASALFQLVFHGFGGGGVRLAELMRLKFRDCCVRDGQIFFRAIVEKRASVARSSSNKIKKVSHCLPYSLSRKFLLYRTLLRLSDGGAAGQEDPIFPAVEGEQGTLVREIVRDFFSFSSAPTMIDVRHLWCGVQNIEFGKNKEEFGMLVATNQASEQSGHTGFIHGTHYGSMMEGSMSRYYKKYHEVLGEGGEFGRLVWNGGYSTQRLHQALIAVYGKDATFYSDEQERAARVLNSSRHAYIGLRCGEGKTVSFLLGTASDALRLSKVVTRLVIVPYR